MQGSSAPAERRPAAAKILWLGMGVAVLVLLSFLSIALGVRDVPWSDIVAGLGGQTDTIGQAAVNKRIPRTVMALLAGFSLSLAGVTMQGVTRNPLADPGILGINAGASLAIVIALAWFDLELSHAYVWVAVLGAAITAVFVYGVASMGAGGASPLKLALAGTAVSIALSSFITAVVLPRADMAGDVQSWMVGGVGGITFDRIALVAPFILVGSVICLFSGKTLNAMALGDELATGLGENVIVARILTSFGAVLLCAAVTAVCGPIGFVGLAVPHACRLLFGLDHRWLLPASAIAGGILLIFSDILGRLLVRPSELDVGILTAILGAPVFILIVRRRRIREL